MPEFAPVGSIQLKYREVDFCRKIELTAHNDRKIQMISDLRHIRAFLTAARLGNFTRAAAELHVSQSAFSVQIKQLEDSLGVMLFDRSKRRVALTSAARDLVVPLERILIDLEAVAVHTQELAGLRRGIVSIAALPSVAAEVLPQAIKIFTETFPGIAVRVQDVVSEKLIEAVKQEQVDFGIGSKVRVDRELKMTPLFVDRFCAFVIATHPIAKRKSVTLEELSAFPLILTGKDSSVRELLERAFRREKLPITIAYEKNHMSTAIGLARAGLGVAALPECALGGEPGEIRRIAISKPLTNRKIEIIQRRDRTFSPAALKMVEVVRQCTGGKRSAS